MTEQILGNISIVIGIVFLLCWFCGVYFHTLDTADVLKKILDKLDKLEKENKK